MIEYLAGEHSEELKIIYIQDIFQIHTTPGSSLPPHMGVIQISTIHSLEKRSNQQRVVLIYPIPQT